MYAQPFLALLAISCMSRVSAAPMMLPGPALSRVVRPRVVATPTANKIAY